ncbi:MAG: zinc ABC transporter substrate-binding protein [Elusimicrobia bacterium]|nr:zinc ABC transporter substrate-binding protein [Elusimicrobiota bacterium]MDE2236647.1 zinc ABC transporter substrate-binding protein [Elusimicrobiota bacterium]MDE2425177.1 zinc ABC transporter substrate-binding protein [Elusimicrobiota bacterium]
MNKPLLALALAASLPCGARAAKLRVVATFPDLADIARDVGATHVRVVGIARGTEDPHQVVMKPSFVPKLHAADAVVFNGLTLEHSFLPGLLEAAANPNMRPDTFRTCLGQGCIDCSKGVPIRQKPADIARSQGELHPMGNPHYDVDPENGLVVAKNIAEGLSAIDPAHAADYERNEKAFAARLRAKIAQWKKELAPLKGVKAVSFHEDVAYLGHFTGLDFIDTVEFKPGVPATPAHWVKLIEEMKAQNVKLIVHEQQYSSDQARALARQTGARIATIGVMGDAFPGTAHYIDFVQHNIDAILAAAGMSPRS